MRKSLCPEHVSADKDDLLLPGSSTVAFESPGEVQSDWRSPNAIRSSSGGPGFSAIPADGARRVPATFLAGLRLCSSPVRVPLSVAGQEFMILGYHSLAACNRPSSEQSRPALRLPIFSALFCAKAIVRWDLSSIAASGHKSSFSPSRREPHHQKASFPP